MKTTLSVLLVFIFIQINAQHKFTQLEGQVLDSLNNPLPVATVVMLQATDSVLYGFTTSDEQGKFVIPKIEAGTYIVRISFIGYSSYSENIEIRKLDSPYSLGRIIMEEEGKLLDDVSVEADAIPIMIKGDTVEYNAASFKTQSNATVEELLKKLPGIEIDRDGGIKAQGEEVKKVLVDGKEFFGDDPKIATKNLPADAINKVQVFDKSSEMSEFTGIDDGEREKTINLKLEEDKKNGVFGNVEGAYGNNQRYDGRLNFNRFTNKSQLSLIASGNNINKQSFTLGDYFRLMGGRPQGGTIMINSGDLGESGNGLTDTGAGGINFNIDLSKKTEIRSSYFYNQMDNELLNSSFRENYLDNGSYTSISNLAQNSFFVNHRFNLRLEHKISENADLIFTANLSGSNNEINGTSDSELTGIDGSREILTDNLNHTDGSTFDFKGSLMYRQKLKKPGRFMVMSGQLNNNDIDSDYNLISENIFMPDNPLDRTVKKIDQLQNLHNDQIDYSGKVSYTEPLGKKRYLEFNYTYQNYNTDYEKLFYDILSGSNTLNSELSNIYNRDYFYNLAGVTFTINHTKTSFNSGLNYQDSYLNGSLQNNPDPISKRFNKLLPWISYRYKFTTSKSLDIRYTSNLNEPSLEQLQPQVDNSNPTDVYLGNPDLKAEYRHNLSLGYHSFDAFSNISIFGNIRGTYTFDKIVNARSILPDYTQITQPINTKYEESITAFISFNAPLKAVKSKFGIDMNTSISKGELFLNDKLSEVIRSNQMLRFTFGNEKKEKLDWQIGTQLTQSNISYSAQQDNKQSYLNQSYFADLVLFFGKWEIENNFDYNIYSGQTFTEETVFPLWTASISRKFLKADRGELSLYAFDLLNQYKGISRNSNLNYAEESTFNALSRYIMLRFTYKLNKFSGRNPNRIEIIERRGRMR